MLTVRGNFRTTHASSGSASLGANTTHVTGKDSVDTASHVLRAFSMALEALIIAVNAVGHEPVNPLLSKRPVGCAERVRMKTIYGEVFIWKQRKVATDVVFGRIGEFDSRVSTSANRKVVGGIAPSAKSMDGIFVQYGAVVYVSGV